MIRDDDVELENSPLSGELTRDGVTVRMKYIGSGTEAKVGR